MLQGTHDGSPHPYAGSSIETHSPFTPAYGCGSEEHIFIPGPQLIIEPKAPGAPPCGASATPASVAGSGEGTEDHDIAANDAAGMVAEELLPIVSPFVASSDDSIQGPLGEGPVRPERLLTKLASYGLITDETTP